MTLDEFTIIQTLDEGTFGSVSLVKYKKKNTLYTLKVMALSRF